MPAAPDKRPSYLTLAAIYTTLRQTVLSARYELRGAAERFVLIQDLRYIDWPDRFYGVGNFTRVSNREDFVDRYLQADSEFYIRAWRRVFIGARYHLRFSDTRDVPEQPRWLDPKVLYGVGPLRWSGLGAIAMLDNRDSVFWPKRGQLAVAQVTMYRKWLGSQFNADRFRFEIRHFQRLSSRQILAIRGLAEFARGQVPFQLLPALGGSEIFRGWFLGRLRDKALLDLEVEWRQELGRRWAVTGFAAVGKVGDCVPAVVQNFPRAAIGAGIRFAIKPEDRAHVRLDISYGDATNLYLQFREAF